MVLQIVLEILPCPLCLEQRYAYYFAFPSACSWHFTALPRKRTTLPHHTAFAVITLVVLVNAGLGAYHAGVEWGFWLGPTECNGTVLDLGKGSLLEKISIE